MPIRTEKPADRLALYAFHGLDLAVRGGNVVGDCPFCGKPKFGVRSLDGTWNCFSCGESGNEATFPARIWEASLKTATDADYQRLADDRKLLRPETLREWGVVKSVVTGEWMVPGYGAGSERKLEQLYRYAPPRIGGKATLTLPPGGKHALFGVPLYRDAKAEVHYHESLWNGIAWREALRAARGMGAVNVLAGPGCGAIGSPFEGWLPLLAGKKVSLFFDSDHPKPNRMTGGVVPPAGYEAVRRAYNLLTGRADVEYLKWGDGGYDPARPSGYDVRDHLAKRDDGPGRAALLRELTAKLSPPPEEWSREAKAAREIGTEACTEWVVLRRAWQKALEWRHDLDYALSVMLAVCLSTDQIGDQLFLMVIGEAGSGKTRLCDGILTSHKCFALEHLTGFHSGWKDSSGEDFSLLARINHKTLVTPEGDVLMSSPKFAEIMSQQRRIFDGVSGASFKNRKEDMRYTGLRTPWVMAGTPALMDCDQSRLGDRFLKVYIRPPGEDEKLTILERVGYGALRSVVQLSNGKPDGHVEGDMLAAYRLTGGYVDYLREKSTSLLRDAVGCVDEDALVSRCARLADFVACLRARPPKEARGGGESEADPSKELPTRLTHQLVRLGACLVAVLGKDSADDDVMGRLTRVALDTSRGRTLNVVRVLYGKPDGENNDGVALLAGEAPEKCRTLLRFLRKINVVTVVQVGKVRGATRWKLTQKTRELYNEVVGNHL